MPKRLGKFELPSKLTKVEEGSSATYAKFIAEPFEAGYGHTIGNSLRRVLLSSIEGSAISSIKIDGVNHEFQSVDGVVEDVTDMVLNLKKILLVSEKREPFGLTCVKDAMTQLAPGPLTRSAAGTRRISPIASRIRGLVRLSISASASHSVGSSVRRSNSWTGG